MKFQIEFYDHNLSECEPVETKLVATFKEAVEIAVENIAVDLASDRTMIWDVEKEKFRANLVWNEDAEAGGAIEAWTINDKKLLASGEEGVFAYYQQRGWK